MSDAAAIVIPGSGSQVSSADLSACAAAILRMAGMASDDARETARVLVFAQESGIDSHGLAHLPAYLGGIASGALKARPVMRVEGDFRAAAVLDADGAPGALAGVRACAEAVSRARECGVAVIAVRNSAHFGAASAFAERMAEDGMISLILSNASPTVAPRGARTALLGTNPIAAGFPRADGAPVLIDFATTVGTRGRIRKAAGDGMTIPADWALDSHGRPTTDAAAALAGTMQALGGAKGTVLPLLVEMLCVGLSGGAPGAEVLTPQENSSRPRGVSHLFVAMDGRAFGGADVVATRTARISALVENAAPADAAQPPRMPGSRGAEFRARTRREGVRISPGLNQALEDALSIAKRMAAGAVPGEEPRK